MFNSINIEDIKKIALNAGKLILEIYNKDFSVDYKDDKSPLTEADTISNIFICKSLNELYPNIPIMSEENKQIEYITRKDWEYYFCVDPIDGTKEFIKKNGEFTINIALVHKDTPILGVVYAPVLGDIYSANKGEGSFLEKVGHMQLISGSKKKLPFIKNNNKNFTVVASKSHLSDETQTFIDNLTTHYPLLTTRSKGSSLKLCMVAEGSADIYPRLAPTMEWDTAAADAIVRESGKMTYRFDENDTKKAMTYNKEDLLNPWFIVK